MLFDYVSSSEYDIDINAILEFYNSFNLIKPIDELVANWIEVMRYAYKNNRCYFSYDKNKPCEYYQQIIKIPSIAQFYIHFNVDKAVDVAQNYDYQRLNA